MELIIFTATGIILYVVADALLPHLERLFGIPVTYRPVLFFAVLLALALAAFSVLRKFGGS